MKTVTLLTIVQLISLFSFNKALAYVLPLDAILTKSVATTGNQIFSVEQDVIFKLGAEEFMVRETWLIEGDKNLRLTALGLGPLKDLVRISAVYNNKAKTTLNGKNKTSESVSPDFFERYLSIRSTDSFKKHLTDLFISPAARLSRAGGIVAFAIGEPSRPDLLKPQMWIDQDLFLIRKIRLPSGAEVQFENFEVHNKIYYPKNKKVDWAGYSADIKVRQINTKVKASLSSFYPQNLDQPTEMTVGSNGAVGAMIQDFYKRFR